MKYIDLCSYYQRLDSTPKRLEKTSILTELLKKASKDELKNVVYLLHGTVFPEYDERKLGVSSQLIIKAITTATGANKDNVLELWRKTGDLGLVAEELVKEKKQTTLHSETLDVGKVFSNIEKLATLGGKGTVANKVALLAELLGNSSQLEAKYIVRTVLGTLRVGVAEGILRDAIAKTFDKDVKKIEEIFNLIVDYGEVAKLASENKLGTAKLIIGRPLELMLAVLAESIDDGFKIVGKPAQFESKLDGFRLQIHKYNNEVKLFTRRLEEVTKQFPDVVGYVNKYVKAKSFIIDCEAVGIDGKTGKYLPFQGVSQRVKRKHGVEEMAKKVPIELNVFDVLYCNGKNLFDYNLKQRREILEKIITQKKGKIILTNKLVTSDSKKASKFFKEALDAGLEGVMIKNISAKYRPGRYVNGWAKMKSILEPLDLVIVKAEWGEGKRARYLSSYTIACKKGDKFVEIGKVSTGMKEKTEGLTFDDVTKLLKPLIVKQEGREVIVKPEIILEIGYQEIQKSPNYSSGFALRFPKVIRLRMKEKNLNEINSVKDVEKIFNSQHWRKK